MQGGFAPNIQDNKEGLQVYIMHTYVHTYIRTYMHTASWARAEHPGQQGGSAGVLDIHIDIDIYT
jgi:hypothetical protein